MAALATFPRTDIPATGQPRVEDREVEESAGVGRPITLLTPSEVAAMLRVKLPRIYEAVKTRRLRAVRIGRLLRFRRQDIESFLERYTTARW